MDLDDIDHRIIPAAAVVVGLVALFTFGLPLVFAEYFPYQSLWKQRNGRPTVTTPSYAGRTVLVTGAAGAFGSRAAKLFAQRDVATLILVDLQDCADVIGEIEDDLREQNRPNGAGGPKILAWQINMMTAEGCNKLAKYLNDAKLPSLDHALLTAGILAFNRRESPDGWETTIQVNYLSTAQAALTILPYLKSSPSNPNPPVLTFVTSFGIYPSSFTYATSTAAKNGDPKSLSYLKHMSTCKDGLEQSHQYGRSKALLLYFARELAARTSAANNSKFPVTITSADPGSAWTPLTNPNQSKLIPRLIMNISARDPLIGATALVNGVSAPASDHGKILQDFESASYPPFMERKSGLVAQKRVWDETRVALQSKVPELSSVYESLEKK